MGENNNKIIITKEQLTEILKKVIWKEVGEGFKKYIEIIDPDIIEIKETKPLQK